MNKTENKTRVNNRVNNKFNKADKIARKQEYFNELNDKFSKHIVDIVKIIKYNSEIRRFTAIGIINNLKRLGKIEDAKTSVVFKWDKFSVYNNGLIREFKYNQQFFLSAFVASFTSFSAYAQNVINAFCEAELNKSLDKSVSQQEVDDVVVSTDEYVNSKANNIVVEEGESENK